MYFEEMLATKVAGGRIRSSVVSAAEGWGGITVDVVEGEWGEATVKFASPEGRCEITVTLSKMELLGRMISETAVRMKAVSVMAFADAARKIEEARSDEEPPTVLRIS